jgi:ethanolaminephosphotransferase
MVMHMMLAHMCEEPYWLLRKTFSIFLVVALLIVVGVVPWVKFLYRTERNAMI